MVVGLDKFKEAFADFKDNYVIIGGTACDIVLSDTDMRPRPAGLVVHPEHVSCQDSQVEFVFAGEFPQELAVLVAPLLLVLVPEVGPELLPGCRDERDAVALDHVEEHLALLPFRIVLLVVVPIAEDEGDLYVQSAFLLLVHDGFQKIAGPGAPACGEPS